MIAEMFRAVFQAGVPVFATSFLLVWWALRRGHLEGPASVNEVEQGFRRLSGKKEKKKKKKTESGAVTERADEAPAVKPKKTRLNPVHDKWLTFGGGFYGVVALLTYAVVELGEIRDFIARYDGLAGLIANLSFGMVIEILVDAMMNFIVAIAWPVYWLSDIAGQYIWVWFAVAYGGYWLGVQAALRHFAGSGNQGG